MEASADLKSVTCLGPSDARSFAVYLHGMDSLSPSAQELGNRQSLARAAALRSIRIALPRASAPCPGAAGSVCWGWTFDAAEIDASVTAISSSAEACFGARPYGLIGFSNGGHLLSKLVRTCTLRERLPGATWAITFGSALFKGPLEPQPASLKGCGRLVVAVGTDDVHNLDPSDALVNALRAKGADVASLRFGGGHLVPEEPLLQALELAVER